MKKRPHIRRLELASLLRKLRYLLPLGRFEQAEGTLGRFIAEKRSGHSEFEGFGSASDVPLGLANGIKRRALNFLDRHGIETLGELDATPDAKLFEIDRSRPKEIAAARRAAEKLRIEFEEWQAGITRKRRRR